MFRKLFKDHDGQQEAVIAACAAAERAGLVEQIQCERRDTRRRCAAPLVGREQEGLACLKALS